MDLKHRVKVLGKSIHETNLEIMSFIWMLCVYVITIALLVLPLLLMWKYNLWEKIWGWSIYIVWILYILMVKTKFNRMRD